MRPQFCRAAARAEANRASARMPGVSNRATARMPGVHRRVAARAAAAALLVALSAAALLMAAPIAASASAAAPAAPAAAYANASAASAAVAASPAAAYANANAYSTASTVATAPVAVQMALSNSVPYLPSGVPPYGAPLSPQSTSTARPAVPASPTAPPAAATTPRAGAGSAATATPAAFGASTPAPGHDSGAAQSPTPTPSLATSPTPTPSPTTTSDPPLSVPVTDAARICAALGVLRGDGNGVDGVYLAKSVTRIQAVFITLRLLGLESAAMAGSPYPNFNDVYQITDHASLCALAYMRANPQLGWQGDENGMVDPNGYVTVQTLSKVLLAALGYEVGEDFAWEDTVSFAAAKGLNAPSMRRWYITNSELASMLADTLKLRLKDSEATLVEALVDAGVVDVKAAAEMAMLPGVVGYEPLLAYAEGGPLIVEVRSYPELKRVSVKFNTSLNPAYAKATKNYRYHIAGSGYVPLPARCATKMLDESTIEIQFPADGWAAVEDNVEKDAYSMFIATARKAELLVSGLQDVDGNSLPDVYIDVPE